jgi:maleate cis-trans isomerase
VSPYSDAVNERAAHYFKTKYGLDTIALQGFRATDAYAIGQLGPQHARDAFARIDRPGIEVFVVPGGNFPRKEVPMTLLLGVSAPIKVGETRGRSGCAETRHPLWG